MNLDLTQSIVRVLQQDGTTAGTGFFVSKNGLIATCAHVVSGYQPGEEVFVVLFSSKEKHKAIIEKEWWRKSSDEDIAILRLLNTPSHKIFAIPLGYPWHIESISLVTFGFPASKPIEGLNGKCEVVGRTTENGCPVLQMRSPEVTRGFSGAPVLNPVTNRIVGMITAISKPDQYGRQSETTFITPSDVLANVCLEVEEENIERIIINLKSERALSNSFVDLAGHSSSIKDIKKNLRKEPLIADQLGLDPIFRSMENTTEGDSEVSKIFVHSRTEDAENFSDGVVRELGRYARCVLLGEAGAGKSTVLARVVLDAAEKRLVQKEGVIPVHLKLSAWQADQSFVDFIYSQWTFASDPITSLENGYTALYLDGLNEIGSDTDTRIKQLRGWLAHKPQSKKIIITCRADDYLLREFDLNIPIVKIESMEESRIRLFSKKYLDNAGKDSELFLSQLFPSNENRKDSSLIKLASNPFMLTALIYCYANSKSPLDILPKNKGLLSRTLVEALWGREKTRNWSGWLPYDDVEPMFSKLAFFMIESENMIEISIKDAQRYCSLEIIYIANSANIIKVDGDKLKFYHQLMQEFFAAVELKRCGLSKKLQRPQIERGNRKDSRWDQVVVALCGICEMYDPPDNPDNIVNYALKVKDPYLAAVCISSGIEVHESTIKKTVDQLIENIAVWDWLDSEQRSGVASKAISDIGKPAVPFLINFFESKEVVLFDRESVVKGAGLLLAGGALLLLTGAIPGSAIGTVPLLAKGVQELSKNELFQMAIRDPAVHGRVKEAIDDIEIDPIRKIRLIKIVVAALGEIGDARAVNTLQKLAKSDSSEEVRKAAKLAIAKIQTNS